MCPLIHLAMTFAYSPCACRACVTPRIQGSLASSGLSPRYHLLPSCAVSHALHPCKVPRFSPLQLPAPAMPFPTLAPAMPFPTLFTPAFPHSCLRCTTPISSPALACSVTRPAYGHPGHSRSFQAATNPPACPDEERRPGGEGLRTPLAGHTTACTYQLHTF